MTPESLSRIAMLLGEEALQKLHRSRVALFGLGGVGGYAAEGLVRSGVGSLFLVDSDRFHESNLNRQLAATRETLGRLKTEVIRERILSIDPDCRVEIRNVFFLPATKDQFDFSQFDFVIDAVDTLTAKLTIIEEARRAGVPIISCMGTGNKLDPTQLKVSDLYETSVCPLARVMRRECKKRGIDSLRVVWSTEEPLTPLPEYKTAEAETSGSSAPRRDIPGSAAFVPAAAGMILAAEAVKYLIQ